MCNEFECPFDRAGDDRFITNLDDRPVEQAGIGDDGRKDFIFRRVFGQREFLELRLFLP